MKLKVANQGYANVLQEIGGILNKLMISKDVEEIFNHYIEVVNSDEAAAVLTLAEILSRRNEPPPPPPKPVQQELTAG